MKKCLVIIIAAMLLIFPLSACKKDIEEDNGNKPAYGDIVIYDFENWDNSFQLIKVLGGFGAVNVNESADFVFKGSRSAKLQPLGNHSLPEVPYMILPTFSELNNFNYQDLTKISKITMQVYNAENESITMGIGLIFSSNGTVRSPDEKFVLKSGWNSLVFNIDPSMINLSYNAKECYGVYLSFENVFSRNIKDAPVLYLDEVSFNVNKEPSEIKELLELDPYEVCDFEKYYQEFIVASSVIKTQTMPEISVVKAADYNLEAPSGSKVLRLLTKPGTMVQETWPSIYFSQKFMKFVNLGQYKDSDVFCFDVYNNTDDGQYFHPQFWTNRGQGKTWDIIAQPGRWTTFRVTKGEINQFNKVAEASNIGKFVITWGEHVGAEREFFFDNFRIEKA